jgi:hypothetical protein
MAFENEGFFSPDIDRFRAEVRALPECKVWFDYAEDLNRIGLAMLKGHEAPLHDRQRFLISLFFIRAHESFQAAILLAERGLIGDARTVARSAVESAIALIAVAADSSFPDQLIAAHRKQQLTVANLILGDADYRDCLSQDEVAKAEVLAAEVEALKGHPEKAPKAINWADVANKHCKDLYHVLYRMLSADGTHATVVALDRYVEADANMQITALKFGPVKAGIVDTTSAASLTFIWAALHFAHAFGKNDMVKRIEQSHQRFIELPRAEPKQE